MLQDQSRECPPPVPLRLHALVVLLSYGVKKPQKDGKLRRVTEIS